jgi:hypothetical protein
MGFWDDFTGKSQQKDLTAANKTSEAALKQGYTQGQGYYNRAYDEFAPVAQIGTDQYGRGRGDTDVYRQAIGLGTPEEQAAAQDRYFNDPAYSRMMQPQFNAMMRYQNARGHAGDAKGALAGARVANEGYQGWLDRTRDVGQNAMQTGTGAVTNAATGRSNVRAGQGEMAYGYGATRAGNAQQFGNAMAASRSTLSNNLLGLAGVAANAYASRPRAV